MLFKVDDKFEDIMYTIEMAISINTTNWFYNLYIDSQDGTHSILPSRLDIAFLLDSGASLLLLNMPTYKMITQSFIVFNHDQHDTSKTSTISNHSEFPIR